MLAGVNIKTLLEGARSVIDSSTQIELDRNNALYSAVLIYLHNKNGLKIINNFFFNPEMEYVGKWYRQLMSESIGKTHDLENKVVNAGITPMVSIGSTDLHSMVQLYLGGPKDKFTNFVYSEEKPGGIVPDKPVLDGLVNSIECK